MLDTAEERSEKPVDVSPDRRHLEIARNRALPCSVSVRAMRILLTSVLFLAALPSAAGATATRPQRAAISHPASATKVVLRISSGGGFVTPQTNLRALPSFTLYGDGTVIVPGVIVQIYPGPAVYPLVRSKLRESQVQALLRGAVRAGLLARGAIDYGMVGVSDMPTTTVLLNAAGRHVKREAYALGATGGTPLPARQARAREQLTRFIAGLPHGVSGARYAPRALAVYVAPSDGQAQPGSSHVVWPLRRNLATAGTRVPSGLNYRCISVGGADARTLLATLRKANELSRWTMRSSPGQSYQLIARPLLPDEADCASLAA
jgi:hypothetical protein